MHLIASWTGGVIRTIDGKLLAGSHDAANGNATLHVVSRWDARNGVVVGQCATDAKTTAIPAIPQVLRLLKRRGCTVTIAAMGC